MPSKRRKPAWWQLYAGLPLLCGLFVFEIRLQLDQTDNIILQLMILCLIFVFLQWWLRANRGGLMEMDEDAPEWRLRVYEIHPASGADNDTSAAQPLIQLPAGEMKGVLSTTFEMDAEQPDSLFHSHVDKPGQERSVPVESLRSPSHKE